MASFIGASFPIFNRRMPDTEADVHRPQQEMGDYTTNIIMRVIYLVVASSVVMIYPMTKGSIAILCFSFLYLSTGVILFFSVVKLEVSGVPINSLERHRDRLFHVAYVHWIVYGTIYFFSGVSVGYSWGATVIKLFPCAMHLACIVSRKEVMARLGNEWGHAHIRPTGAIIVVALYIQNIALMFPTEDDNILTVDDSARIFRFLLFLTHYLLYVFIYDPYTKGARGSLAFTYLSISQILYMDMYSLFVVAVPTVAFQISYIIYWNRECIIENLSQDAKSILVTQKLQEEGCVQNAFTPGCRTPPDEKKSKTPKKNHPSRNGRAASRGDIIM